MKFQIVSEVIVKGIGKIKHEHTQEFADDSNVFGRSLEYRQYMHKTFPECDFELVSAKKSE